MFLTFWSTIFFTNFSIYFSKMSFAICLSIHLLSPRWAEWQQKSWWSPDWRPGQHRLRPRDRSVPTTWPRRMDWWNVWDAHNHWHSMRHWWRSRHCRSVPQWQQVRSQIDWVRFIGCRWVGPITLRRQHIFPMYWVLYNTFCNPLKISGQICCTHLLYT